MNNPVCCCKSIVKDAYMQEAPRNEKGFRFLETLFVFGSPTWTRTRDLRINSPSLYRLSYRGKSRDYSSEFFLRKPKNTNRPNDSQKGFELLKH